MAKRRRKRRTGLGETTQVARQGSRAIALRNDEQYHPDGYSANYPTQPPLNPGVQNFKTTVIYGGLALGLVGGAFLAIRYLIRRGKENNAQRDSSFIGDPANYAKRLRMAFDNDMWLGMGTDEERVFKVFEEIPTVEVFEQVQKRYEALYQTTLAEDLESELTSEEYEKVTSILYSKPDAQARLWKLIRFGKIITPGK